MSKGSKVPAVLGGCGCASLVLSLLLFAGFFLVGRDTARDTTEKPVGGGDTIETRSYVNRPAGRTGNLAAYYTGFKFDYPLEWKEKPQSPEGPNFVTVERNNGDVTYENFNVGYFDTAGGAAINDASYTALIQQLQNQFTQQYSNLQKVTEGPTRIAQYDGYEALFTATVDADGRRVDIYTRTILLPTPDKKKGVAIIMMGTSLAPELKKPTDLGTSGGLPVILRSFRFME